MYMLQMQKQQILLWKHIQKRRINQKVKAEMSDEDLWALVDQLRNRLEILEARFRLLEILVLKEVTEP